jgi:hypothetical protein
LYRAEQFPRKWALAAVLMRDIAATDTTLAHHHGKWWMFTAGLLEHTSPNDTLFLFYSDSPLGPWHAHPKNPIVRDARRARPAGGLYIADGRLVRPGQDCSRGYGSQIHLQKIELLTETEYQETPLGCISAERIPGCCGVHTFNQSEHFEVLDAKFMIPRFSYGSFR